MRRRQAIRQFLTELRRLPPGHLRTKKAASERLTFQKFRYGVGHFALLPEIENHQDVWM